VVYYAYDCAEQTLCYRIRNCWRVLLRYHSPPDSDGGGVPLLDGRNSLVGSSFEHEGYLQDEEYIADESDEDDEQPDQNIVEEEPEVASTPPPPPPAPVQASFPTPYNISSPFFVQGVIVVNKKHPLLRSWNPGENAEAVAHLNALIAAGREAGVDIMHSWSGFRTYDRQAQLFNSYASQHGIAAAETFSARPGFSEHQTGLAFDLLHGNGQLYRLNDHSYDYYVDWVAQNASRFGFIVRYRSEWQHTTGFMGEPWHLRYLGVDLAQRVFASGQPLETFLGFEGGDYRR